MEQKVIEKRINICFVANFYKTILYHQIAQELRRHGFEIYWIVLKEEQYKFLAKEYSTNNLLWINRLYVNKPNSPIGDIKVNEILYGDRVLKYDKKNGQNYLKNIQRPIYDFILQSKIKFIFGERTWGHEIVIGRILEHFPELNCVYYSFTSIRIPGERFAFLKDEIESIIVEPNNSLNNTDKAEFILAKPEYLKINDKIVKKSSSLLGRLDRIRRFITNENIEKNDPNVIVNQIRRIKVSVREELNRETYKLLKKESFENIQDKKYIFLGFHKQPESSIDVLGRYFDDQAQNVINIWRLLPPDWFLVIKEHTNAIGDRGYLFYKKILKYPNIVLTKETTDSHILIKNSQIVFTVSGTIALEAALMDIPSITLTPTFFNRINYCKHFTWTDIQKYKSIIDIIKEIKSLPNNTAEYKKYILENSFEANTTDIYTCPDVIEEINIKKIAKAFLQILPK